MFHKLRLNCALFLMIFTLILVSVPAANAQTADTDTISARSYIVMDADSGKILKSKNAHLQLPPASMTKMMTLLLALEAINQGKAKKTDMVVTSEHASAMDGTRLYLEPGETMTLDEMLKGMALASANDASVAVAEHLAGSEEKFVAQMNQKAAALGMKDTQFKNACGMPAEGHYSSAYDMAVLARYLLANTDIITYSSLKETTLRQGAFTIHNGNRLLWTYEGADGLKTGYTSEALNCLTATAKRGKLRLIAVVMACPYAGHTHDATALLNDGFNQYTARTILPANSVVGTVAVKGGTIKHINAVVSDEVTAIYPKNESGYFTRKNNLTLSIKAPVKKGQKLGEMVVLYNKKEFKKVDLVASEDVSYSKLVSNLDQMPLVLKVMIFLMVIFQLGTYRRQRLNALRR